MNLFRISKYNDEGERSYYSKGTWYVEFRHERGTKLFASKKSANTRCKTLKNSYNADIEGWIIEEIEIFLVNTSSVSI